MFFIEYFPPGAGAIEREEFTRERDYQERLDELTRFGWYVVAADYVETPEPEEIEEAA